MIYLHKLLPLFVSPLFIGLLLILWALLFRRRWPLVLSLVVFFVAGNSIVAEAAMRWLERDWSPVAIGTVPAGGSVVVLGGMVTRTPHGDRQVAFGLNDNVDRFETGLRLMATGRFDTLILSRGALPWTQGKPEGEILADWAIERGIDPSRIRLTEVVPNTAAEAAAVAGMLDPGARPVLITSAFHMNRALALFQAEGLDPFPMPTDFRAKPWREGLYAHVPKAAALEDTSFVLREAIGRAYYAIRK